MSDAPVSPRSDRRKTAYPGLVWAVPIAALLIVLYLGIDALANRGEVVTVTFQHAADARPKDTKVLYEGVEAGELIKILPNEDGRRIDFQLRLIPQAKQGLNSNARFWLIGASPTLSDLSSLKAVVSGVAIGYAPGEGGTPTTHFDGLQQAPTVLPGDKGTHYTLTARTLGSVADGTILLFHGQAVGKITAVEFEGEAGFRQREKESIDRLTRLESIVLATGGGAVIDPDNRKALAERGAVVYLATSIDQQIERTRHGRHRPLLKDTDPEQKLRELMLRRAALYAEIADLTVSTDGRRVQLVAEEIHHELRNALKP